MYPQSLENNPFVDVICTHEHVRYLSRVAYSFSFGFVFKDCRLLEPRLYPCPCVGLCGVDIQGGGVPSG